MPRRRRGRRLRADRRPRLRRARSRAAAATPSSRTSSLAKDADGKVRYVASFVIFKPVDMAQASGLMWHDVPNRGRTFPMAPQERAVGDVVLASAWQGDNAGATAVRPDGVRGRHAVAAGAGGARRRTARRSPARCSAASSTAAGPASQPLLVQTNPVPYKPVSARHARGRGWSRATARAQNGDVTGEREVPSADWAWARCDADQPVPRHARPDADLPEGRLRSSAALPGGVHRRRSVRARHRLRRVARRRPRSSRRAKADDAGTPNPIAGRGHAQHRARRLAVGQLPARLAAPRLQPGRERRSRCTTACGRSSPAAASR